MKAAAVYPSKRSTGLADLDEPKVTTPHGVKLRILRVGVCGTDREICAFDYGEPPSGSDFLVLGHETIGEVMEVGSAVSALKPGDLAVPMVRRPCDRPDCVACRAGRQDFCYTGAFTERGIKERHGFMTEMIVDEEIYMNPMPAELREIGVLTEPLTIAEKGLEQVLTIQKRLPWGCPGGEIGYCHKAVVLGAGPVGLLGAMALKNAGFDVVVYSKLPAPNPGAEILAKIGATYISSQETPVDQFASMTGNIDLVFEAVGASQFAFDVVKYLGTNGLFVLTGIPSVHDPVKVDTDTIMRNMVLKNQALIGTVNADKQAFANAIKDLGDFNRKWPDAVRALITARYPLDRFQEPINSHDGIKNVIEIAT